MEGPFCIFHNVSYQNLIIDKKNISVLKNNSKYIEQKCSFICYIDKTYKINLNERSSP